MFATRWLSAALFCVSISSFAADPPPVPAIVEAHAEANWYFMRFGGVGSQPPPPPETLLKVSLQLSGPEVDVATRVGGLKIESCETDQGPVGLSRRTSGTGKDSISFKRTSADEAEGIALDLFFTAEPGKVERVKSLKGSCEILTGDAQTFVMKEPFALHNARLNEQALKDAGLELTINKPGGGRIVRLIGADGKEIPDDSPLIDLRFVGPAHHLVKVVPLDAQGKRIDTKGHNVSGSTNWVMNGKPQPDSRSHELVFWEQPKDLRLEVTVLTKPRTVHVPFEVTDLEVPSPEKYVENK